jgi:hypothetical protein
MTSLLIVGKIIASYDRLRMYCCSARLTALTVAQQASDATRHLRLRAGRQKEEAPARLRRQERKEC